MKKIFLNDKNNDKYGLYIDFKDDIFGRGNSITNLTDGNKLIFQLWNVDSGSDHYNKTNYQYDAIHDEQIELFSKLSKYTRGNSNTLIPSFAFIHIPLFESSIAYDEAYDKKSIPSDNFGGEIREKINTSSPLYDEVIEDATRMYIGYKNTHFFSMAKDNGVKGIFYGHDHVNDFWSIYERVLLVYGTKSSDQLYYLNGLIGGNLLTIHKDGNIDLRRNDKVSSTTTDFKQVLVSYGK